MSAWVNKAHLTNIALRGVTLGSKFLLIFFLAKFLEPSEVGLYGLLAATVGYAIYLVGFEFYTYSARELIVSQDIDKPKILINQFFVYLTSYIFFVPVLFFIAERGLLPRAYLAWIFLLLFFEHFAQELNRILISLSQQLYAGVVLFVRMGLWCLIVIFFQWFFPETRTVAFVLAAWLGGSLFACGMAAIRISRTISSTWRDVKFDVGWIKKGARVALPFFVASIALKGMATFDRYFVESTGGADILGVYVVFIGAASAVISFLDAGIVAFAYPKLVALARLNNFKDFSCELAKAGKKIIVFGGVLIILFGLGGYLFVDVLGKEIYRENLHILYWILLFTTIQFLSVIPHLGLYSLNKDRAIMFSQIFGFVTFLLFYVFLVESLGFVSILIALSVGWGCIFLWKMIAFRLELLKLN